MKTKCSKTDFNYISLPHNRRAQFGDILKHRFPLLILTAIFIFIGFLPLVFIYGTNVFITNVDIFVQIMKQYNVPQADQGFIYFWLNNFSYLIMIPLMMIACLFLCGGLRIYRLLAWDEGVFFFHDFFKGIKMNFKQGLIVGLFLGLYIFISHFISGALTLYVNGTFGMAIELFLMISLLIFFLPIAFISLIATTYFKEKIFESLKNSFYVYGTKFYWFALASLAFLIIYVFPYFGNYYLILLGVTIIILFVFPIYVLIWNQLFAGVIDVYGNDPKSKMKGIYDPSKSNNVQNNN